VGAYPIYFLMLNLRIDPFLLHYTILGYSILFVLFIGAAAWLSDRVGRKPVMLSGFVLTALACYPIFLAITHFADPALEAATRNAPVHVVVDPADCNLRIDPIGIMQARSSCDIARKALAKSGIPYTLVKAPTQTTARIFVGSDIIYSYDSVPLSKLESDARNRALSKELTISLAKASYPSKADPGHTNTLALIALIALLNLFVALTSGPLAAWLVEMFPTRIRDTSLSIAYNLGAWFGGFLPTIVFSAFTLTGNFYSGLWYAAAVLLMSATVGIMFLPETRGRTLVAIE
jgi:MFS family permease